MESIKKGIAFLKEVLSEDGRGSCSRLVSFAMVMSAIAWVTYIVIRTHTLPDMGGPTMWASGGALHYGLNKAPDIMGALKNAVSGGANVSK